MERGMLGAVGGSWVAFVDNLSRRVHRRVLWDRFSRFGKVIKVFIPFVNSRPNYKNKTFAFVHFASKEDLIAAKEKMNNVLVDGRRILVSFAKYQRSSGPRNLNRNRVMEAGGVGVEVSKRQNASSQVVGARKKEMMNRFQDGRTYKDTVVGLKKDEGQQSRNLGDRREEKNDMDFFIPLEERAWLRTSLTGIVKVIFEVEFVQRALRTEGINVKVVRWGYAKNACLVVFRSVEEKEAAIEDKWEALSFWFERLEPVIEEKGVPLPYCSVSMMGVPLNCWSVSFFTSLASRWGKLVKIQEQTAQRVDCRVAQMLLRVESPFDIPPYVIFNTLGRSFTIKIKVDSSDDFFPELEEGEDDERVDEDGSQGGTVVPWERDSSEGSKGEDRGGLQRKFNSQQMSDSRSRVEEWVRGFSQGGDPMNKGNLKNSAEAEDSSNVDLCNEGTVLGEGCSKQSVSGTFSDGRKKVVSLQGDTSGKEKVVQEDGLISKMGRREVFGPEHFSPSPNKNGNKNEPSISDTQVGYGMQNGSVSLSLRRPFGGSVSGNNVERGYHNKVYVRRRAAKSCDGMDDGIGAGEKNQRRTEAMECWKVSNLLGVKFKGGEKEFLTKVVPLVKDRDVKARAIRRFVEEKKPTILFLQESKLETVSTMLGRKMGGKILNGWAVVPAVGSAGGLITMWNQKVFVVKEKVIRTRFVALKGWLDGIPNYCCFINVYGPSVEADKEPFFRDLFSFLEQVDCPVCLGGDFNAFLTQEEKRGGDVNLMSMNIFRDFVSKANLIDLPLLGGQFTWCNNREVPTFERLDRFLVDHSFFSQFPKINQNLQPRSISDHNIILLENRECNWGPKPFRLFNYMLVEEGFSELLTKELFNLGTQENSIPISKILNRVKDVAKNWAGKGFLQLPGRIRTLESVIQDMEMKLQQGSSLVSMNFIVEAKRELWELQKKEESIWMQKSRLKWRLEGDKNSRFFHHSAAIRGRINYIKVIKVDGEVIEDPRSVKASVVEFFKRLYNQTNTLEAEELNLDFLKLSEGQCLALEKPFSEEEVWEAIAHSDINKAPGPDGLNLGFFKKFWPNLKDDMMRFFRDFYVGKVWEPEVNFSFISLIPKKANPEGLEEFRPISLVGGLYKVISKVLARRLSLYLNDIISQSQFAFIPGRNILDCSFIANESIDFWRKRGLKGVVFKVDFMRAYDSCMSTAEISVLLNGSPTEKFHIYRGLRQGCSLSPMLFNLATELLHLLLTKAVDMGLFSGFDLGLQDRAFKLSHLQFADDLIIFSKGSIRELRNIRRVLLIYELLVGLKLNLGKSRIFGINVEEGELTNWAEVIGCSVGYLPSEYLGLPLGYKRNSVAMWDPIVARFNAKLSGWIANSLSIAGRVVLVKSVLCSLPVYFMSMFRIPAAVILKLNSIMASFLWGDSIDKKKIHWVNWKSVSKPRNLGGLGVPNLALLNRALLGKWVWKFSSEKKSWWKKVICAAYNLDPKSIILENSVPARASWIWKGVVKNFFNSDDFGECLKRNMRLKAGKGEDVQFWNDVWLGDVPLKSLFPRLYVLSINKSGKVKEFRVNNASGWVWDIQMRRNLADWEVEQWMQLISMLNNTSPFPTEDDCWIWLGNAPPRVELFVWQLVQHRVPVKEELAKRGVAEIVDQRCVLCGREVESVSHLFLHCRVVWGLWSSFLKMWNVSLVTPKCTMEFLILWDDFMTNSLIWRFIPRAVMWSVWKCRNEIIFQKGKLDLVRLSFIVRFRVASWFSAHFKDVGIPLDSLVGDLKIADSIGRPGKVCSQPACWVPPPEGFLKLNVDGAMVSGWEKGGIGGLFRDSRGLLLQWFSEAVGSGPPILAELLVIKRGICLMEELDFVANQRVILVSDSSNALKWIQNLGLTPPLHLSLVKDIVSLLIGKDIIFRHISRAANWEVDKLAKDGIG
ncbi:hypothetical protein F3Y22_tig00110435pilonHSYRG00103 [Hibiscus syriacus]|uniref:RRM domain-containing protein n=1 Tax=Hibiscus syriacus TaxID=106335 RepID=A0A6A3ALX9_HIBSY|nr:hypothetical protein F3Y22_tig00110435pilonHSYRG00103 [Hibiscus syriacus]